MNPIKVNVLGTDYEVTHVPDTDSRLKHASGGCNVWEKEIIINNNFTYEDYHQFTLRHELIHAYLHESGNYDAGMSEEMVTWIAHHLPNIIKSCEEVGGLKFV